MSHRGRAGAPRGRDRDDSQSPSRGGPGRGQTRPGSGSGFRGRGGPGPGFEGRGRGPGLGGRGYSPARGGAPHGGGGGADGVIFSPSTPATVDPRLSPANLANLTDAFKKLTLAKKDPKLPLRPGFGTLGREITLRANFFPLRLSNKAIYDYNVQITAPRVQKGGGSEGAADTGNNTKKRLFELLETRPAFTPFLPHIAHDRMQRIVSAQPLPQPLDIQVPFYEEGESGPPKKGAKVYTISIVFTRQLDMSILTK